LVLSDFGERRLFSFKYLRSWIVQNVAVKLND